MTSMGFDQAAAQRNAYVFSDTEKAEIRQHIIKELNLTDEASDMFVNYVEQSGTLPAFGVGSLLTYSHLETSPPENGQENFKPSFLTEFPNIDLAALKQKEGATLEGFAKDFVCYDIHYRGTNEEPGITIGIDEVEGASTNGKIIMTNMQDIGLERAQIIPFIKYYVTEYKNREFPPNMPIYKFDFKPMRLEDGSIAPALACIADQNSPLYAGHLSVREKADILAQAGGPVNPTTGEAKKPGMITDMDYMRNTINSSIEEDVEVPDRFINLYTMALGIRKGLDADIKAKLKGYEVPGAHTDTIEYRTHWVKGGGKASFNLNPEASDVLELHQS